MGVRSDAFNRLVSSLVRSVATSVRSVASMGMVISGAARPKENAKTAGGARAAAGAKTSTF